ncbi:MAG: hypothetical protein ACW987_17405 [Candidatus Thorarchaeota archaeon]|jgi:hypothetical protein
MAADEVRIILRGSSKELEASIARIGAGLRRLQTQSVATNRTMQASAQRTSKSINTQNRSFTLMVAKLALVTFAVQTLANIINSTFGAMLKNIDDFNVAAIGTASAVTGISDVGDQSIGETFNQNLQAALATFEALEIVAAEFFSTGQELQLAFNTLAQRGVVIREDEFRILGKITDQIKLLTGGQNTQIQIQQELRAILDGNVRTTTAFGKSLQARGVDIQQLSREVRATGSLKPFEPFLTGLDAAGPAIRRTLSSVTATFSSLFKILQRNIFQDTFDGLVSQITEINNIIIDQRDTIVQIGIFIKDNISSAWDTVLNIIDKISATIIRIVQNDLVQFATVIVLIGKLVKRGPLGIFLALTGGITAASGEVSTFGNIITILTNGLAIGFDLILQTLDAVARSLGNIFEQIAALFSDGLIPSTESVFLRNQIEQIQKTEDAIINLKNEIAPFKRRGDRLFALGDDRTAADNAQLKSDIEKVIESGKKLVTLQETLQKQTQNTARSSKLGKDFIEARGTNLDSFTSGIADGIERLAKASDDVAADLLPTTKDEFDDLLQLIKDAASGTAIPPRTEGDFANTAGPLEDLRKIEAAREKAAFAADDRIFAAARDRRKRALNEELADIKKLAAADEIDGKTAFDKEVAAKKAFNESEIAQLQQQIGFTERRLELDLQRIKANQEAGDKDKIDDETAALQQIRARESSSKKVAALEKQIADLRSGGAVAELDATTQTTAELEKQNNILDKRDRDIATRFARTNADSAATIDAESALRIEQFKEANTTQSQQTRFEGQERLIRTQKAIENQVKAITGAIEAAFDGLIDGIVEGSFEFRDIAQTISKDLIKSGLQGLIEQTKKAVSDGLTKLFDGFSTEAAKRSAQALALGLGLLIAVLSRIGNDGDFTATGGSGGSGVDSSSIPTRGLVGGDTQLPIAQINNGLLEALIPTNAILAQIERNTRSLTDLQVSIGDQVGNALQDGLNNFFDDQVLQNAQP